jgi:hypothetical protein
MSKDDEEMLKQFTYACKNLCMASGMPMIDCITFIAAGLENSIVRQLRELGFSRTDVERILELSTKEDKNKS